MIDLFDWIDHDKGGQTSHRRDFVILLIGNLTRGKLGGTITIDEFMTGFKWINEPLRAKSLVKLQDGWTEMVRVNMQSNTQHMQRRTPDFAEERLAGDLKLLESTVHLVFVTISRKVKRSKKLLGAKGIATRNEDATRGSWPYY